MTDLRDGLVRPVWGRQGWEVFGVHELLTKGTSQECSVQDPVFWEVEIHV